ncbi:MAG: anti-sigma factor domain-containing protein [Chloroflexota bacterium]
MTCDEVDELLAAYALEALPERARRDVEEHLATCDLHPALEEYQRVVQLLAVSVPSVQPPREVRDRLMARVYRDAQPTPWRLGGRWLYGWLAAAALLLAALGLGARDLVLSSQLAAAPQRWTLQPTMAMATAGGTLTYLAGQPISTLTLMGLRPLPSNGIYEIWLIKGGKPRPAGLVRPSPTGLAAAVLEGSPLGYDAVAVTIEPGPRGSPAPTSSPFVLAHLNAA